MVRWQRDAPTVHQIGLTPQQHRAVPSQRALFQREALRVRIRSDVKGLGRNSRGRCGADIDQLADALAEGQHLLFDQPRLSRERQVDTRRLHVPIQLVCQQQHRPATECEELLRTRQRGAPVKRKSNALSATSFRSSVSTSATSLAALPPVTKGGAADVGAGTLLDAGRVGLELGRREHSVAAPAAATVAATIAEPGAPTAAGIRRAPPSSRCAEHNVVINGGVGWSGPALPLRPSTPLIAPVGVGRGLSGAAVGLLWGCEGAARGLVCGYCRCGLLEGYPPRSRALTYTPQPLSGAPPR